MLKSKFPILPPQDPKSQILSHISSAQLHVTFDVGNKHGGIFTYVEIPRKVFDIFIISVGSCMQYMYMQKGDNLSYSDILL